MFKKIVSHFGWTILVLFILFIPDILFTYFEHPSFFTLDIKALGKQLAAIGAILFFVLAIPRKKIRFFILALLATFTLAEQLHFIYYHSYIKPYEIKLFFEEQEEILETVSEIYHYFFFPLILYLIELFILKKISRIKTPLEFKYALAIAIVLLLAGPIIATKRKDMYVFMPSNTHCSVTNLYTTLSYFMGHELLKKRKNHHYKPYKALQIVRHTPQNIIVIMGESLSSKKMSLFGYKVETTPNLDKLKNNPQFLYKWGYSCGVCTKVSLPTFFTLKREPLNTAPLLNNVTNLTRLAKKRGYHVYYITMQNPMLLSSYIAGFSDKIVSQKGLDEKLLAQLKKIDFSKKNFIILHQRNSHSPYDRYTPPSFYKYDFKDKDYNTYMLHSYYNSILYTDSIISKVFETIDHLKSSAIVFATSDHGELLGTDDDHKKFGHSMLDIEVAKVPLLIYYNKKVDPKLVKYLKETFPYIRSHYDFGKAIAYTLGYKVINPNEDNETIYINGTKLLGQAGFMQIKQSNVKICNDEDNCHE